MYCEMCKSFLYTNINELSYHLSNKHKIKVKEYYDTYLKKPDEGFCHTCFKPTRFRTLSSGYASFCCNRCAQLNEQTQEKLKAVKLEKYGSATYNNRNKAKKTCLKIYGHEHPNQNADVIARRKETCIEKYGGSAPLCNLDVQEKAKETCMKNHGTEWFIASEEGQKIKNDVMIQKYGTTHALQNKEIMSKMIERNIKKYGCKSHTQSPGYQKRVTKKYKYDGKQFASKLEIEVYKYLSSLNIKFDYQPEISFSYMFEDKQHTYHPDFQIGNIYVETKGLHFFKDKDINSTMINPFDRTTDDLYEAKHQCMLKNNVIIVTNIEQLKNLIEKELSLMK